jgi:3-carboxy-cis,cis-muconate cycloisomerase
MPVRLIESLATTEPLAALFSDHSILGAMLGFEAALARAEANVGVIPATAAEAIALAARPEAFDAEELSRQALRAGTLSIPLVKALTAAVRAVDAASARFVHWGATSQDVSDTAIVVLLARAAGILASDHEALASALRRLSESHAQTVMLGRTLLQPAPPVTFGLKTAGWLAAIERSGRRMQAAFEDARVLQFGGASGTLAALGDRGIQVSEELAKELGLQNPPAPWHAHRDRLATLVCACGVYAGSLAKMARDVALLMQEEVSEASEPGGDGRGGSSTMPHKRNPMACAVALAAANHVPGCVASFLHGMTQEHERGIGGWQAEWSTLASVVQATGLVVASMREVAEGLTVNAARMRANIEATHGVIFAERAMMLLGAKLGRDRAHELLHEMTRQALETGRRFAEIVREQPEAASALSREEIDSLDVPEHYLGSAEAFRKRLLGTKI